MRLRPPGRAALGAALAAGALAAPALAAVTPSPTPTAAPPPVAVALTSIAPLAPQPGDTLTLQGTLRNVSASTVGDLQVQLLVSRGQIGSRDVFDHYADEGPDGPFPADAFVANSARVDLPTTQLRRGASAPFTIRVAVDTLGLPAAGPWQVHALGVDVIGLTPVGTQTLGRLHTFLPWAPVGVPGVGKPTQVAWIWPLIDRPHRAASAVWNDDVLAGELKDGGRLARLVAAGAAAETQHAPPPPRPPKRHRRHPARPTRPAPQTVPVPLTWAVDPLLADEAAAMRDGYRVRTHDGDRKGSGQAAADAWLRALRDAVDGGSLLEIPYADPDVVAAVRGGLPTVVQLATQAAERSLQQTLGRAPLPYSWPPDGALDQRTLNTLFAAGISTLVLDDTALPPVGGPPSETPSAHTTVPARDGNLDALLVDTTLSTAVDDGALNPSNAAGDVQRVLCELLMIQAELPSDQRTIVIAPDRRWAPSAGYADALLADTGKVPWIAPVSLPDALASPVYDKVERGPLTYPPSERLQALPRHYVRVVRDIQDRLDRFASILPDGDPQVTRFDDALRRALSSSWRTDLAAGTRYRDQVAGELDNTMHKVRIALRSGSLVTLTSHSGTVPVTVTNDLDTPVTVVVGITADQRLRVSGRGRVLQTIAPRRKVTVDLRASAKTSGVFTLSVALYTKNGQPFGSPVQLRVRSTAYGVTALAITGGATIVLLIAVAVRLARRSFAARRLTGGAE